MTEMVGADMEAEHILHAKKSYFFFSNGWLLAFCGKI